MLALAALAACGGTAVAIHYHALGLTLTHYDARAHLVVAGRADIDALRKRELGFCPDSNALEACYRRLKRESLLWALLLRRGVRI